nr:HNH endonuclease signature motif containing protein [Bifidobacterium choerinum]
MSWYTSDRRGRLPLSGGEWAALRKQVRDRARNRCEAREHSPLCDGWGSDCDHIVPGDDNRLENLQWLNANCHRMKTAQETSERNRRRKQQRKHPKEKNPGMF